MKRNDNRGFILAMNFGVVVGILWILSGVSADLDPDKDSIEATAYVRSYITGPIEGRMSLTKYDAVSVFAGELPPDPPPHPTDPTQSEKSIRRWALWGDIDGEDGFCFIQKAYNYGRWVTFLCPFAGTYIVFAEEGRANPAQLGAEIPPGGDIDDVIRIWESRSSIAPFDLSGRFDSSRPDWYNQFLNNRQDYLDITGSMRLTYSDPIEILDSDYCYYWNYRLKEKSRVGYVFRESEPSTGTSTGGSYILMELAVWIIEPNSITESEKDTASAENLVVAGYSKVLTRRFNSKGLLPCLRKVHPSIELSSDIRFVEERESQFKSPHWSMELKIHTDTIISILSDVSFTISSRQHVALFHCFVGDVRLFINVQDFDFIDKGQNERNSVNWERSVIPKTKMDYLEHSIKHVFGHQTVYTGQTFGRGYQPGDRRSDVTVINNPCVAQEFALALAGRVYVVEEFLNNYRKNVKDIILTGLEDLDADQGGGSEEMRRRHGAFLSIADVAFTPTHVVVLMDDSSMYIHSHSVYYQGFAYLTSTKKSRLGALVKRRWCARTGTPKTNNMIIPAFSSSGNIIIIQIYPVEGSVNMWVQDPPESCQVQDPNVFLKTLDEVRLAVNETCIHRKELVDRSDERGLPVRPDDSLCDKQDIVSTLPTNANITVDELDMFLMSGDTLYSDIDPHFPKELTNLAIHKISDNDTFFNKAFTYQMDSAESTGSRKLEGILERNGLTLETPSGTFESKIILHAVEFTAVEKRFMVGVEFKAEQFDAVNPTDVFYDFTMLLTSIVAVDMPAQIHPISEDKEEQLHATIAFPGVLLVRTVPYMVKNQDFMKTPLDVDVAKPYTTKLFAINTAIPAYVIDLGNVFVFSSVESKYARPLTFYRRKDIQYVIRSIKLGSLSTETPARMLADNQRLPVFSFSDNSTKPCVIRNCTDPSEELFDIVVTEQGTVSVLNRRSVETPELTPQSIYIGSVMTLDSLRELRPFSYSDHIFQLATPDGEIVYGKYQTRCYPLYRACTQSEVQEIRLGNNTDIPGGCLMPPVGVDDSPYCAMGLNETTLQLRTPWRFVEDNPNITKNELGFCDGPQPFADCVYRMSGSSGSLPPDNAPFKEISKAEILKIPFASLLNGNLQLVPEEKISVLPKPQAAQGRALIEDKICPFANFEVKFVKFDYAEIGFKTRITGRISYLGKNVPSEAELVIEYDNVPGIQVEITSAVVEERDQTTLSKTIDVTMRLSDIEYRRLKIPKMSTNFRDKKNLAREATDLFSITVRPSIINLRCKKEDFFITVHYTIGCNPFNRMRLLSEASPVVRKRIQTKDDGNEGWYRQGDNLIVPREEVWHKQRGRFKCSSAHTDKTCSIPYAYLYEDNVYDISWRDEFVPQFEQFLRSHTRRVSGNIIVYDLLGSQIITNISSLQAGCTHTAEDWYKRLLDSTHNIGQDTTEQEDIYNYFVDCFDSSIMQRDKPRVLSSLEYRAVNLSNHNRIRFDMGGSTEKTRTKNRNQILIFRAVVINTNFNRFTYCKLMDTFFLLRITGIQPPRKGLSSTAYAVLLSILILFFATIYLIFAYCYVWKLDVANLALDPDDPAFDDMDDDDDEKEESKKKQKERRERYRLQTVAIKLQALANWREYKQAQANKKKN